MTPQKNHIFDKFLSGGALGLVRLGTGFIRVKYLSLVLGLSGIGLIAQVNQFYLLSISIMTLSMAVGLINRTRDPMRINDRELRSQTQGTTLVTILALSLIYIVAAIYFSDLILKAVFDLKLNRSFFYLIIVGLPFSAIATGYFEGLFFSRDRYDLYVKCSAVAAFLELSAYVFFVSIYGLKGAMIAIGLSGPIIFFCFAVVLSRLNESILNFFRIQFLYLEFLEIMKFSFILLSSTALGYFITLWVRTQIIKSMGIEANGLLQPALAFSAYSLPFITNGIWGHLHPQASLAGNTQTGRNELHKVLYVVVGLSGFFSLTIITFSHQFIQIAFSHDFLDGEKLIPYQFGGDFLYYVFYAVNVYFLATSQLKFYFLNWIIYYLGLLAIVEGSLSTWGVLAYSKAHLIMSTLLFVINSFWLAKNKVVSSALLKYFLILFSILTICILFKIYSLSLYIHVLIWLAGILFLYIKRRR